MNSRDFILSGLLALLALGMTDFATPAFAAIDTYAWGNYLDHNFVGTTAIGFLSDTQPYFLNKVAWSGPDGDAFFVLSTLP